MCYEYQRLKFQWKNGSKFSHLLTGRAEGANLTTSLTVILTAKIKDDIKEMTNWHLTKLMTKEVTDPCSPQLLVWSLVSPVHSRNEYIFSVEFVFQIADTDNLTAINRTEMPNHLILSKMSFFEDLMSSIFFVFGWQATSRPSSIQNQMLPWQKMERCRQHQLHRRSNARHQFLSRGRRRKMQILVSANNWNISSVENLRQKSHQCCPLSNPNPIRRGGQHCL